MMINMMMMMMMMMMIAIRINWWVTMLVWVMQLRWQLSEKMNFCQQQQHFHWILSTAAVTQSTPTSPEDSGETRKSLSQSKGNRNGFDQSESSWSFAVPVWMHLFMISLLLNLVWANRGKLWGQTWWQNLMEKCFGISANANTTRRSRRDPNPNDTYQGFWSRAWCYHFERDSLQKMLSFSSMTQITAYSGWG